MKFYLFYIVIGILIVSCDAPNLFTGCDEGDYRLELDNAIFIKYFDKDGNNLLEVGSNTFPQKSIKVRDQNGDSIYFDLQNNGTLGIYFLYYPLRDPESLNQAYEQFYTIHLDSETTDTLYTEYQIGLDDCEDKVLNNIFIQYNDSIFFNQINPGKRNYWLDIIK